jgi:hypothetical protein
MEHKDMYELNAKEVEQISGGELNCSAGIPSGISCSGNVSDWKAAAISGWNYLANNVPTSLPFAIRLGNFLIAPQGRRRITCSAPFVHT